MNRCPFFFSSQGRRSCVQEYHFHVVVCSSPVNLVYSSACHQWQVCATLSQVLVPSSGYPLLKCLFDVSNYQAKGLFLWVWSGLKFSLFTLMMPLKFCVPLWDYFCELRLLVLLPWALVCHFLRLVIFVNFFLPRFLLLVWLVGHFAPFLQSLYLCAAQLFRFVLQWHDAWSRQGLFSISLFTPDQPVLRLSVTRSDSPRQADRFRPWSDVSNQLQTFHSQFLMFHETSLATLTVFWFRKDCQMFVQATASCFRAQSGISPQCP